jgi:hypothetical protein
MIDVFAGQQRDARQDGWAGGVGVSGRHRSGPKAHGFRASLGSDNGVQPGLGGTEHRISNLLLGARATCFQLDRWPLKAVDRGFSSESSVCVQPNRFAIRSYPRGQSRDYVERYVAGERAAGCGYGDVAGGCAGRDMRKN